MNKFKNQIMEQIMNFNGQVEDEDVNSLFVQITIAEVAHQGSGEKIY